MKVFVIVIVALVGVSLVQAQRDRDDRTTTTPVPILKSINKVNEDGSYTYGYENADGSYKIETKDNKGQVQGKYGYYDDAGTLREIEYGASKSGFYPTGTDINAPEVAPHREDGPQDGSYDPELYTYPYQHGYQGNALQQNQIQPQQQQPGLRRVRVKTGRRVVQNAGQQQQFQQFQQQQPQQQQYQPQPQQYQQPQPQQYQQPQYQQPQQPQYQQPNYYQAQPQAPVLSSAQHFQGHPARNIDLNTGSYSVNYSG